MVIIFSQNAPTQSLLAVVNGILDESIERKKGEIPHVCLCFKPHTSLFLAFYWYIFHLTLIFSWQRVVYLLRKVVQEIERRLCVQAEHIRNVRKTFTWTFWFSFIFLIQLFISRSLSFQQNTIIKTREEKYCAKIKALEILVHGTNEENQVNIIYLMVGRNYRKLELFPIVLILCIFLIRWQ